MTTRDPNLIQNEVDYLKRLGVDPNFSRPLLQEEPPVWLSRISAGLATFAGFTLPLLCWVALEFLGVLGDRIAANAAAEAGALGYSTNTGFGFLFILFGCISASGLIAFIPPLFVGQERRVRLALKHLLDHHPHNRIGNIRKYKDRFEGKSGSELADALLRWERRHIRWMLLGFVLIAVGVVFTRFELQSRAMLFADRVVVRSHLPPYGEQTLFWRDAEVVELGCNQTENGGSLVFRVSFVDGSAYRMASDTRFFIPMVDALEEIDAELQTASPRYERWDWLNRDPAHPACLRSYAGVLGSEGYERLADFLRLTEEERQRARR